MGDAPGAPGIEPRWTSGAKAGVGTACSDRSRVWFTLAYGIVNEVYYPFLDQANLRDMECLVLSRDGRFWEEKRDLDHHLHRPYPEAPLYCLTNADPDGRFRIEKRVFTWPDGHVLLQDIEFQVMRGEPGDYRLFVLLAPHLNNQGRGNSARRVELEGFGPTVEAWRDTTCLSVRGRVPFVRASVGFVGASDGWSELHGRGELTEYNQALDGNVALTVELDLSRALRQTVALAFGRSLPEARLAAAWSLVEPSTHHEAHYVRQWREYLDHLRLVPVGQPHARLQRMSAIVLRTHCDKTFPGAIIASLSIPWGNTAGDQNIGGYHLVWPRDLVESAQALVALGDYERARRALQYLMVTQHPDGSWSQNFWVDGRPYWRGAQLDETAFPVHLAYRLVEGRQTAVEDVYPMVKRALAYIVREGPVTQQDRWEENAGYSPATIAAAVTALVLGAELARRAGEPQVADYVESVADSWVDQVDDWTFTENGTAAGDHHAYYQRLHPAASPSDGNIHHGFVPIKNLPPGSDPLVPEFAVIDPSFLELVRYGIKRPDDPKIVASLEAVDAVLRVDMPYGPLWHRYNRDGYGEQADGSPYQGYGIGRAWPLLTGERGHYALALGQDPAPYLVAMEGAAGHEELIPEQIWDADDIPAQALWRGRPTGSARPLVWAHAEYVKLVHSALTGAPFERYGPVYQRYAANPAATGARILWQWNRPDPAWRAHTAQLRVAVPRPARMVWTADDWAHNQVVAMEDSGLGMYFADITVEGVAAVEFTFQWLDDQSWVGRNFRLQRPGAAGLGTGSVA